MSGQYEAARVWTGAVEGPEKKDLSLLEIAKDASLTKEEKDTMRQKRKRDYLLRGESKFEWKWAKETLMDPFVYLLGTAFFTSSVAINGFNVFLPSIINGLG